MNNQHWNLGTHRRCRRQLLGLGLAAGTAAIGLLVSCGGPSLLRDVVDDVYASDEPLAPDHAAFRTTLQVRWLGTACYHIQLGDVVVFTDPFFSHHSIDKMLFGQVHSDLDRVAAKVATLPPATAIFLGHAHYDHILDLVPTLEQPGWADVPVYASETAAHIMCGYDPAYRENWHAVHTDGQWHAVPTVTDSDARLEYMAVLSEHAPQLPGIDLYLGSLDACLAEPPTTAAGFPKGENYAYVFRLSNSQASYTIYMAASATNSPIGFPDESVDVVDLAILGVAGWTNVSGYPVDFVERLQPRYIMPTHYNDFFDEQYLAGTPVLSLADLDGFLQQLQPVAAYDRFEGLRVIEVDSIVHFE